MHAIGSLSDVVSGKPNPIDTQGDINAYLYAAALLTDHGATLLQNGRLLAQQKSKSFFNKQDTHIPILPTHPAVTLLQQEEMVIWIASRFATVPSLRTSVPEYWGYVQQKLSDMLTSHITLQQRTVISRLLHAA